MTDLATHPLVSESSRDAALYYAALGWPVLPLHSVDQAGRCTCGRSDCARPAKHPVAHLVRQGVRDATTDTDQIRRFYAREPLLGVGIATGVVDVLDVDPRHGGSDSIRRLMEEEPATREVLRETVAVRTGSGGLHYYVAHHPGAVNRVGGMPGLDYRTDGGYVVAPPSQHASGMRYAWLRAPGSSPILSLPAHVAARIACPEAQAAAPGSTGVAHKLDVDKVKNPKAYFDRILVSEADAISRAIPGTQEPTLNASAIRVFQAAEALGTHLPDAIERAYATLTSAGLAMANEPGKATWTAEDIKAKLAHAHRDVRGGLQRRSFGATREARSAPAPPSPALSPLAAAIMEDPQAWSASLLWLRDYAVAARGPERNAAAGIERATRQLRESDPEVAGALAEVAARRSGLSARPDRALAETLRSYGVARDTRSISPESAPELMAKVIAAARAVLPERPAPKREAPSHEARPVDVESLIAPPIPLGPGRPTREATPTKEARPELVAALLEPDLAFGVDPASVIGRELLGYAIDECNQGATRPQVAARQAASALQGASADLAIAYASLQDPDLAPIAAIRLGVIGGLEALGYRPAPSDPERRAGARARNEERRAWFAGVAERLGRREAIVLPRAGERSEERDPQASPPPTRETPAQVGPADERSTTMAASSAREHIQIVGIGAAGEEAARAARARVDAYFGVARDTPEPPTPARQSAGEPPDAPDRDTKAISSEPAASSARVAKAYTVLDARAGADWQGSLPAVRVEIDRGEPQSFRVEANPDVTRRDRIRSALLASDLPWALGAIDVTTSGPTLDPGDPGLDLAIAVALLVASGECPPADHAYFAELGLDGSLRLPRSPAGVSAQTSDVVVALAALPVREYDGLDPTYCPDLATLAAWLKRDATLAHERMASRYARAISEAKPAGERTPEAVFALGAEAAAMDPAPDPEALAAALSRGTPFAEALAEAASWGTPEAERTSPAGTPPPPERPPGGEAADEPPRPATGRLAPIAYAYEADWHCPTCAVARFGADEHGFVREGAEDEAGNEPAALAPFDEWIEPQIEEAQVLSCSDCGAEIARYEPEPPDDPEEDPPPSSPEPEVPLVPGDDPAQATELPPAAEVTEEEQRCIHGRTVSEDCEGCRADEIAPDEEPGPPPEESHDHLRPAALQERMAALAPRAAYGPEYSRPVAELLPVAERFLREAATSPQMLAAVHATVLEAEVAAGIRPGDDLAAYRSGTWEADDAWLRSEAAPAQEVRPESPTNGELAAAAGIAVAHLAAAAATLGEEETRRCAGARHLVEKLRIEEPATYALLAEVLSDPGAEVASAARGIPTPPPGSARSAYAAAIAALEGPGLRAETTTRGVALPESAAHSEPIPAPQPQLASGMAPEAFADLADALGRAGAALAVVQGSPDVPHAARVLFALAESRPDVAEAFAAHCAAAYGAAEGIEPTWCATDVVSHRRPAKAPSAERAPRMLAAALEEIAQLSGAHVAEEDLAPGRDAGPWNPGRIASSAHSARPEWAIGGTWPAPLSPEEEQRAFVALRFGAEEDAKAAREQIVGANLRLATAFAGRAARNVSEREEFTDAARLALVEAVDDFDPTAGARFGTFAVTRMRTAMRAVWRQAARANSPSVVESGRARAEALRIDAAPDEEDVATFAGTAHTRAEEVVADPRAQKPEEVLEEKHFGESIADALSRLEPSERSYVTTRLGLTTGRSLPAFVAARALGVDHRTLSRYEATDGPVRAFRRALAPAAYAEETYTSVLVAANGGKRQEVTLGGIHEIARIFAEEDGHGLPPDAAVDVAIGLARAQDPLATDRALAEGPVHMPGADPIAWLDKQVAYQVEVDRTFARGEEDEWTPARAPAPSAQSQGELSL